MWRRFNRSSFKFSLIGETMNIKDYKLKRPKEGYNTFEEREYAKWSEVSEWELFIKNKK